jgi:hypothetical protein
MSNQENDSAAHARLGWGSFALAGACLAALLWLFFGARAPVQPDTGGALPVAASVDGDPPSPQVQTGPRAAEAPEAAELPTDPSAGPRNAREFLADYPGGEAIMAALVAKGHDLDIAPPLEPLDKVWNSILDQFVLSPEDIEKRSVVSLGWDPTWSNERIAQEFSLSLGTQKLEPGELQALCAQHNERILQQARETHEAYSAALQAALNQGDFLAAPYMSQGEELWKQKFERDAGDPVIASIGLVHKGWSVTFGLRTSTYPPYTAARNRLTQLKHDRLFALQGLFQPR